MMTRVGGSWGSIRRGLRTASLACLGVVIVGCASIPPQTESLCNKFESSWNALAEESAANTDVAALAESVNRTAKKWSDLAALDAPADMMEVTRNAASHLTSLWSASSNAVRHAQGTSLRNAGDYMSTQCEKLDHSISLSPLSLPSKLP